MTGFKVGPLKKPGFPNFQVHKLNMETGVAKKPVFGFLIFFSLIAQSKDQTKIMVVHYYKANNMSIEGPR